MADDENSISWGLDLDDSEFLAKALEAQAAIGEIGSAEGFAPLLGALGEVGIALGAVGVAVLAFKTALDLTTEAEDIQRVNTQFNTLTKNAGIAPEALKTGLESAAQGLVSTEDLLKIANSAIVKMGTSAQSLPQIMDLATKSVQVYGGDAKTNFENITNAIANGNTRMLKQYGIIVDATKAQQDFAAANNTTVAALSQQGKNQAILNAALEQGAKAYAGITVDTTTATSSLQLLKVTFSEVGEAFTLAFEKTIGPGMRAFLGSVQKLATALKLNVQAAVGDAAESSAAKLTLTKQRISEIQAELVHLNQIKGTAMDLVPGDTQAKLQALPIQLKKYQDQLVQIQGTIKDTKTEDDRTTASQVANSAKVANAGAIDIEKQKKQYAAYKKQQEAVDQAYYTAQSKNINSLEQIEQQVSQQRILLQQKEANAIDTIRSNQALTAIQKEQLIATTRKQYAQELETQERQTNQLRTQLLTQYTANSKSAYDGIARSFAANTKKMQLEQQDFGNRGNQMWNSLSSNATSAFTTMGQQMAQGQNIGEATANALKGFFLGFLGDRAIAEGTVMLLSGIWPPNPVAIAGGGALIALGGALKAAAGSSGAATTAANSPSVQATASGSAPPLVSTSSTAGTTANTGVQQNQLQTAQRTVQVNIAGNYFQTQQTQRALMDLMRQETDATGFTYNSIAAGT